MGDMKSSKECVMVMLAPVSMMNCFSSGVKAMGNPIGVKVASLMAVCSALAQVDKALCMSS
jgi:hypothetical protein